MSDFIEDFYYGNIEPQELTSFTCLFGERLTATPDPPSAR